MMQIILREPLKSLWQGKDPFEEVEKISGNVYRAVETRSTLRFEVDGKGFFLKLHHGTTLGEALKSLVRLRLPVLGADREWAAIHRLAQLGVDTMTGVAFGQKGWNPLRRTSFIITEDLSPAVSLADYCKDWKANPPDPRIKHLLIERVADMVGRMHRGGVNHRDCYLCHFLMKEPFDGTREHLTISLIDLHRSQIRPAVPRRWRNKDIAGLYYSARDIGLTRTDLVRFLKLYLGKPLRQIVSDEKDLFDFVRAERERIARHSAKHHL